MRVFAVILSLLAGVLCRAQTSEETLESRNLQVSFNQSTGAVTVQDKRNQMLYRPVSAGSTAYAVASVEKSDNEIRAVLTNDTIRFTAVWYLSDERTLACRIEGDYSQQLGEDVLMYPYPIGMSANESYLALPDSGGFLFKADGSDIPPMRLKAGGEYEIYQHFHAMMAFYALTDLNAGMIAVFDTPADAAYRIRKIGSQIVPAIQWRPEKGKLGYARTIRFHFAADGGVVALAKYYRQQIIDKGWHKSLREKCETRPTVDRLIGAPHLWVMDVRLTRSPELIDEFKAAGIDKLVLKTDLRMQFPSYRSPEGPFEVQQEKHFEFLKRADEYGYLVGKYMTYSSIRPYEKNQPCAHLFWNYWQISDDNFMPYSGIMQADGKRLPGWQNKGVRICDRFGLKEILPKHFAFYRDLYLRHNAFFLDVEGALKLQECYDPDHPMTRREDLVLRQQRGEFFRSFNTNWVVGTESGVEYILPYYDWLEGPPSAAVYVDMKATHSDTNSPYYMGSWQRNRYFDPPILSKPCLADPVSKQYGLNMALRIPLYELVHGDEIVSVCRWGYPNNKMTDAWRLKDLRCMLYGTPPAYGFSPEVWAEQKNQILDSIRTVCSWVEQVGYDEMTNFEYLSADKLVQKSTFSSGRSIVVNFGNDPFQYKTQIIPSMDYYIAN